MEGGYTAVSDSNAPVNILDVSSQNSQRSQSSAKYSGFENPKPVTREYESTDHSLVWTAASMKGVKCQFCEKLIDTATTDRSPLCKKLCDKKTKVVHSCPKCRKTLHVWEETPVKP